MHLLELAFVIQIIKQIFFCKIIEWNGKNARLEQIDILKSSEILLLILAYTLNECYNFPPYILAASSDNKSKTNLSFIQRENSCQNSLSNFISKRCLLFE